MSQWFELESLQVNALYFFSLGNIQLVLFLFCINLVNKQVAELMLKRALPEVMEGMKLFLKMLSFRLGTLLLCGHRCLSWKWPFIHSFSEMSLEKREEVLKKWSKEKLVLTLRLMFLVVKIFCFYTFFSRVILHLILTPLSPQ